MRKLVAVLLLLTISLSLVVWGSAEQPAGKTRTIDLIQEKQLLHCVGDGIFEVTEDGRVLAPNAGMDDRALMTEIHLKPGEHVVLEVIAKVRKGEAFGVIIGEKDYTDCFDTGWICVNADYNLKYGRLFAYRGEARKFLGDGKAVLKPEKMVYDTEISVAIEILPDFTVRAYYNGEEYTKDTLKFDDYKGGYPGIMTYRADVEFLSAKLTYFEPAK